MKDVKINGTSVVRKLVKVNKAVASVNINTNKKSYLPATLFGFMSFSIGVYVFLVSSTIFLAVKEREFKFQANNINVVAMSENIKEEGGESKLAIDNNTSRISYLNKNSNNAISLK